MLEILHVLEGPLNTDIVLLNLLRDKARDFERLCHDATEMMERTKGRIQDLHRALAEEYAE